MDREMFATATRNFVEEVDPDGGLIPVSSLKDSISVLSVVVKRKRFWLWQKPKYIPTDFKLNDLLTGDEPLTPGEMKRPCSVFQGGKQPHAVSVMILQSRYRHFATTRVSRSVSVGESASLFLLNCFSSRACRRSALCDVA